MPRLGDILSFHEMCAAEGKMLQQGMHFRSGAEQHSVILMSRHSGAKYADGIEPDGKTIFYVGHNIPGDQDGKLDQPLARETGTLTENGKFFKAAEGARQGFRPEPVRVYERLKQGIWVYNGLFLLVGAKMRPEGGRNVCVFKLVLAKEEDLVSDLPSAVEESFGRLIPTDVKLKVWARDKGRCVECGSTENLHFDHIVPFSKGGSSTDVKNVQLLCGRHNLEKSDHLV